jgi:hypothetical protein
MAAEPTNAIRETTTTRIVYAEQSMRVKAKIQTTDPPRRE